MKKIFGVLCLLIALLSGIGLVRQLSSGKTPQPTGNSAYDAGQNAAKFLPFVFGVLGLWLIASEDTIRVPTPRGSWSVSKAVSVVVTTAAAILVVLTAVAVIHRIAVRSRMRSLSLPPATTPRDVPSMPPRSSPPMPNRGAPPLPVGTKVVMSWAGRWRSGTVWDWRGPTVLVRFDDSAVPPEMWVFTNRLQLKP